MKKLFFLLNLLLLNACVNKPSSVEPVTHFELNKYLGKWYEIARLDHSFERGMDQVTAEYSMRSDGGVRVLNRGFDVEKGQWEEAEGKAYFVDKTDEGFLKVSFFGPFYGAYIIFELDHEGYQYAFVSGPSHKYLWLLSRTPTVPDAIYEQFETLAREKGFNVNELIRVEH